MMKLVLAPDLMLETEVKRFDLDLIHPAVIALDMIDVMNKEGGLGLSANQVGFNGQIFVMKALLTGRRGR